MPRQELATELLLGWRNGDPACLDRLVPLVDDELRRTAHIYLRKKRRDQTLQATELVNEVYLKLIQQPEVDVTNRAHFMGIAAKLMRRILVDRARQFAGKKNSGVAETLPIDKGLVFSSAKSASLVALDDALQGLARSDARKAQIVELRYFGGLTVDETAEALSLSRTTVVRDWAFAKAWLKHELASPPCDYQLILESDPVEITGEFRQRVTHELRQLTGDADITIVDVSKGSIILTLKGSQEGYRVLKSLVSSGVLSEVLGMAVEKLSLLEDESDYVVVKKGDRLKGERAKTKRRAEQIPSTMSSLTERKTVKRDRLSEAHRQRAVCRIFVSYSHSDTPLRDQLARHLALLEHQGLIQTWYDRRIQPGSDWRLEIDRHLDDADIVLLLVSCHFMSSDYCLGIELNIAMQLHEKQHLRVIPIILHPVEWRSSTLGPLQALPTDGKPVSKWKNRDEAFLTIAEELRKIVTDLIATRNKAGEAFA